MPRHQLIVSVNERRRGKENRRKFCFSFFFALEFLLSLCNYLFGCCICRFCKKFTSKKDIERR